MEIGDRRVFSVWESKKVQERESPDQNTNNATRVPRKEKFIVSLKQSSFRHRKKFI
jgi:hypothetical protein